MTSSRSNATTNGPALQVRGLSLSDYFYGVDLTVSAGACVAFLGENDAIRTAFLECVAGRRTPSAGTVDCGRITAVWHDEGFPSDVAVERTLALRIPEVGIALAPEALLDSIGLGHRGGHEPWAMSAGERRRIALELAFVTPKDILILDEPERGLDAASLSWLESRIREQCAAGIAVLLATFSGRLANLADEVYDLDA